MIVDDRCVCCGGYVPEGRQVCYECANSTHKESISNEQIEMLIRLSHPLKKYERILKH